MRRAFQLLLAALFVCCLVKAGMAAEHAAPLRYDLDVVLEPARRELAASARITVARGEALELALSQRFTVESALLDGEPLAAPQARDGRHVWLLPSRSRPGKLVMRWRGALAPLDTALAHRQTLSAFAPVAGEEGSFLPAASAWYPQADGLVRSYRVSIDTPAGQHGVVPGRLISQAAKQGRQRRLYELAHPAEGIDLMAGPYRVASRAVTLPGGRKITLRTYFHAEISGLASGYLAAARRYFELYHAWIGPYPYAEFAIVSSPTPTGFGMPAATYLGVEVLKLPFIRETSLGHEILHNWWGNGVFADYASGNWAEGLTTFMADYAYKERQSPAAARAMRLEWLRDFAAVPAAEDRRLADFVSRRHDAAQIVGYNKAAMVFLMLRDMIGRDAFDRGIHSFWRRHRFERASWGDLRAAFEAESSRDLRPFFRQWLERPGAPELFIAGANPVRAAGGARLKLTLRQEAPPYRLRVPVRVKGGARTETHYLDLAGEEASYTLAVRTLPTELVLDPDFRLLRRLRGEEAPPILRQVTLDAATTAHIIAGSASARESARRLATTMQDQPPRIAAATTPPESGPLLVIGLEPELGAWLAGHGLPGKPESLAGKGSAQVWTASLASGKTMAVVAARDEEALAALVRPLPHYGRQSYLVFEGSRVIERGVWPAAPPVFRLAPEPKPAEEPPPRRQGKKSPAR